MTSYDDLVQSYSPLGFWKLGADATDSSGNGWNGTVHGGVTFAESGPIGDSSALFDGSTGYVSTSFNPGVLGAFTILAWVDFPATSSYGMIVSQGSGLPELREAASSGELNLNISATGITGTQALTGTGWHFCAGVWDGSNLYLYVDGTEKASHAAASAGTNSVLYMGARPGTDNYFFKGYIANVAYLDTALTADDISALAAANNYPPPEITTSSLPDGIVGTQYSATVEAENGSPPYTWDISAGSLPDGLSIGSSTGAITGVPSASSAFNFTVKVTDANSNTATAPLSITINTASVGLSGAVTQPATAAGEIDYYQPSLAGSVT